MNRRDSQPAAQDREAVVLLHGLARTSRSMKIMAKALAGAGYTVINQGYPSTRQDIASLAAETLPAAWEQCPGNGRIHVVSHSMGGILLRQYLSQRALPRLGRTVMLGPPNLGTELVEKLGQWGVYRWFNGPAGSQMGAAPDSLVNRLGPVTYPVGVIAGNRSINWLLSTQLPGPNDGKVTVARTRLEGMDDHLVLPVTHPMMMRNKKVIEQTRAFLAQGHFNHETAN